MLVWLPLLVSDYYLKTGGRSMTTSVFTPSNEQAEVIAHRGGRLQVVACAGAWSASRGSEVA